MAQLGRKLLFIKPILQFTLENCWSKLLQLGEENVYGAVSYTTDILNNPSRMRNKPLMCSMLNRKSRFIK